MVLVRKWGDNAQAVLQGQKTRGGGIPDGVETVDNGNVEQQAFQPGECTVNLAEGKPEQCIIAVQVFGCYATIEGIPSLDEGMETIDSVEVEEAVVLLGQDVFDAATCGLFQCGIATQTVAQRQSIAGNVFAEYVL